ncbi:MAG TPA: ATP-binding protein, partial [Rhodocyclaceae bacterium]|nr:ATP-binding protein [Rhodocyclaceae bacterium]
GLELELHMAADVPRFVATDVGKLRQILINLLSNAVKFTRQGGVDLDIGVEARDHRKVTLSLVVRDTGVGVPADEIERIFQPFYQTEYGIQTGEGTGLGLTIARQFAELLGGRLSVASVVGKGSAFTLRLPVETAGALASQPPAHRVLGLAEGERPRRILVVEDKVDNQQLLVQLLEQAGFETRVAGNGEEGVAAFTSWQPDLIWMDMRMPVMDGYEATRRIRALPGGKAVKIVALTASAFREDRGAILAAGCDDALTKPLDQDRVFATLARLLDLRLRYEDEEAGEAQALAPDLTHLPPALRQALCVAARALDMEAVEEAIGRIRAVDGQLAGQLEALARAYRYDRIAARCEDV